MEVEVDRLFENAMGGHWDKVVDSYTTNPNVQEAKITRTGDTALHVAVTAGESKVVSELVKIIEHTSATEEEAIKILDTQNERGNTALHVAAAVGNVEMCHVIAESYPKLVRTQNKDKETPLFLAVLHGKKNAYLCLRYHFWEKFGKDEASDLYRRGNGDTILHVAISGEYFNLALRIIRDHPSLVNSFSESGWSPLHILASKHHVFESSSYLGFIDHIIHHCTIVDDTEEAKQDHRFYLDYTGNGRKYPENYETCISFCQLVTTSSKVIGKLRKRVTFPDEENPPEETYRLSCADEPSEQKGKQIYPPNYASFVLFFKLVLKAFLVILGLGLWRIQKIREKKEQHNWATRIMNELVKGTQLYKYDNNGGKPKPAPVERTWTHGDQITEIPDIMPKSDSGTQDTNQKKDTNSGGDQGNKMDKPTLVAAKIGVTELVDKFLDTHPDVIQELNTSKKSLLMLTYEKETPEPRKRETPILIAAKLGVTEMVAKILDTFPVAIQDTDEDKKNVVLVAVEHRQTDVYKLLMDKKIFKEAVFRQLDKDGNSALHLAAKFGDRRPRIVTGAALQMQWEIKWYKYVKDSMHRSFFVRNNHSGQSAKAIFSETHKELVNKGGEWLTKTSESCSVVAALIATVAFATSATVPGGVDDETGHPTLEMQPAFDVFAISSLIALCFSVTALVFFLAILTSRNQEKDFEMSLPRKLLLGLSSLFISIASMLISFCAGHFFVLKDKLKFAVFPLYTATCLPVVIFFAFAQLPLYFDLARAIFNKEPQRGHTH